MRSAVSVILHVCVSHAWDTWYSFMLRGRHCSWCRTLLFSIQTLMEMKSMAWRLLYSNPVFMTFNGDKDQDIAGKLAQLQASWVGYRAYLTQTQKKVPKIMAKEMLNELDFVSLNKILEQLTRKKSILTELAPKTLWLNSRRRYSTKNLSEKQQWDLFAEKRLYSN